MEFLKVDNLSTAIEKLLSHSNFIKTQKIPTSESLGRICASDIVSTESVPYFARSVVDGYAVLSQDTNAANDATPTFLTNKGYIEIGKQTNIEIATGYCAEIPTGGMVPKGADSIVMVEYTDNFGDEITVNTSVAKGAHIVQVGDDIKAGSVIVKKGTTIKPTHIGALMSVGIMDIEVFVKPSITIFSTGSELVEPTEPAQNGKVRDINTYVLSALAYKHGYTVNHKQILVDDDGLIEESLRKAMQTSDIVILSGGSSQGKKDNTAKIIANCTSPGVFTHGIALKPGKPTILAYDTNSNTVVAGLPGQPMSAMVVFELIFGRLIKQLMGIQEQLPILAKISVNMPSQGGRLTFVPVNLSKEGEGYTATPIFTKSANISTITNADGYALINENIEGLNKGDTIEVVML